MFARIKREKKLFEAAERLKKMCAGLPSSAEALHEKHVKSNAAAYSELNRVRESEYDFEKKSKSRNGV